MYIYNYICCCKHAYFYVNMCVCGYAYVFSIFVLSEDIRLPCNWCKGKLKSMNGHPAELKTDHQISTVVPIELQKYSFIHHDTSPIPIVFSISTVSLTAPTQIRPRVKTLHPFCSHSKECWSSHSTVVFITTHTLSYMPLTH